MDIVRTEVEKIGSGKLTNTEILAVVRDEGRLGRGASLDETDERLFMYLVWLVAKNRDTSTTTDRSVFPTPADITKFEKIKFKIGREMVNHPR
jgi:hypothetical protein